MRISLKFVPQSPINNISALVQVMAWSRSGNKPLSEPMMVSLLTHICITLPQFVKPLLVQSKIYLLRDGYLYNLGFSSEMSYIPQLNFLDELNNNINFCDSINYLFVTPNVHSILSQM